MRAIVVIVLLASSVAFAQPDKIKAEAAARDGQERYEAGEFQLAAERFELAYELDPDPAYLFNLAQSYRLGGKCANAATAYRKLLGIVTSGPNVARVQQYVQQMDACAKAQEPVAPPAETPPVMTEPEASPPPATTSSAVGGRPVLRYVGIGVAALGLVGVSIGALAMRKVGDLEEQREALCNPGCTWVDVRARAEALDADGKRYQRRMLIGYIGGGIALVGGLVMFMAGNARATDEGGVSIAPTDGGAMAVGTFAF